jgi:hypothetical protein
MLSRLRRLARPLSALALLLLLAPAHVSGSRDLAGHDDASMPCCMTHEDGSSGIKADCCAMQQQDPDASSRPAGTFPGTRNPDGKALAQATVILHAAVSIPGPSRSTDPIDSAPPPERLYLRLSVIRC